MFVEDKHTHRPVGRGGLEAVASGTNETEISLHLFNTWGSLEILSCVEGRKICTVRRRLAVPQTKDQVLGDVRRIGVNCNYLKSASDKERLLSVVGNKGKLKNISKKEKTLNISSDC